VSSGAGRTASQRASLVLGLLLGMALIAMAGPRLVAALLDGPADRVVFYELRGATVTDEALRGLIAARRSAAAWHETTQGHREIAEAALQLLHRGQEANALAEAKRAVKRSLTIGPVDPHSWARLAHVAWLRDRDARAASMALRASVQVGAYEPTLTAWRVSLILKLWDALAADDRVVFAAQIRQLAQDEPDTLAKLTVDSRAARIIEAALQMADRVETERLRHLP
jgi:hypothetical protein